MSGAVERYKLDADDNLVITRETKLDDVFDACHDLRSLTPEFGKFKGDSATGHRVASISADVAMTELKKLGIDIFNLNHESARKLKAWLNGEGARFKTVNARL